MTILYYDAQNNSIQDGNDPAAMYATVEAYDFSEYTRDILDASKLGFRFSDTPEHYPRFMMPRYMCTLIREVSNESDSQKDTSSSTNLVPKKAAGRPKKESTAV